MAVTLRGNFVKFALFFVVACFVAISDAKALSHTANVPLLRFPDLPREFYGTSLSAKVVAQQEISQYAIVIDAGSSGCRIHVYSYAWNKTSSESPTVLAVTVNGETWSQKGPSSINSFASNPQNVSQALSPLIAKAQEWLTDNTTWADTPLWLKATAGMRLLPQNQQDEIMKYVREYLDSTPFNFRSAEVIPGWQEGAFAWITVNYLDDKLGKPSTEGALDLGGASTQIVYVPTSKILESSSKILVGTGNNYTYTVYAYSYNGYGLDSVWLTALESIIDQNPNQTVIQTPCLPVGLSIFAGNTSFKDIIPPSLQNSNLTFNGTGNLTACTEVVMSQLYPNTSCASNFNDACSGIKGTYQTPIPDGYLFRAFSGYTYTRDWIVTSMGITGNQGYDIYVAGYNAMFAKTYNELVAYSPTNTLVSRFPFNAIYIAKLLDSLKLTNNTATPLNIAANMVNSQNVSLSVGWTLGAMVYEVVNDLNPVFPPSAPEDGKKPPFWVWIIIGVAAAIFVLVIIIAAVGVARRRKEAAKDPNFTLPGPHH